MNILYASLSIIALGGILVYLFKKKKSRSTFTQTPPPYEASGWSDGAHGDFSDIADIKITAKE